jgi:F-type H+-transporting ATPase subunit gamma
VISKLAIEKFLAGEVDKVTVLYTKFVNTLVQKPVAFTLLPITSEGLPGADLATEDDGITEYLFEPNAAEVLGAILPHYVHFLIYQMVLDARASEHSARMVAMKSATDNAKGLIKDLTLEYNKVRQASITTELLEITTAQMAVG